MFNRKNRFFIISLLFFSAGSAEFLLGSSDRHFSDRKDLEMSGIPDVRSSIAQGSPFPAGKDTYVQLTSNPDNPFVMSVGTSMSQTHEAANTVHPESIRSELQKALNKLPLKKVEDWIKDKERRWFVLRSLPKYCCENNHEIDPEKLDPVKDTKVIDAMFTDMGHNRAARTLTISRCPKCEAKVNVTEILKPAPVFTVAHQQAMKAQLHALHVSSQEGYIKGHLPNFRLSLEAADVLKDGSDEIDNEKLIKQASFIRDIGNPLLFFHHYSNPLSRPHLFEHKEDISWFAKHCADVLRQSPHVTHVCPISQPVGFSFRVDRQTLPPFHSNIKQAQYLENITNAQVAAARAMKDVNPKVKVLMSHQWKSMQPMHTNRTDPRMLFELGICGIANKMYNGKFVELMTPHAKEFDGIALSIYPAIHFNLWAPDGDNCAGKVDYGATVEALIETSKAFPGKDIYIVEAGCNSADPETKRQFIDMMLHACQVARDLGIPVKGVYFWGENNDPDFYSEWNFARGTTHFAPYDKLDPNNPIGSINAAGIHMRDILDSHK